jgi:two-component system response regulator NreC
MPRSVLLALSEPFVEIGVRVTLEGDPLFEIVGMARSLDEILPRARDQRPDFLILDSHYQQLQDGLVATILEEHPSCNVVVLVDHTDEDCTLRRLLLGPRDRWPDREALDHLKECCLVAFRDSAKGCLPKASTPERLLGALHAIVSGEVWAGPGLSQYFVDLVRGGPHDPAASGLTRRELEVVGLLVEGLSNREIADRLNLGEQTIKNHVAHVMQKVGVRNRVELALYAVRERLA